MQKDKSNPFNEKQIVQENEYDLPCHWLLRRGVRERYSNVSKLIAEQIKKYSKVGTILDVGCGDGKGTNDLYHILGDRYSFQGVDYSKKALMFARAFSVDKNIEYIQLHAGRLVEDFGDRSFNTIIMRDVLEHLDQQELRSCLADVHKLLEGDGVLIFTVPSTNDPVISKHYRHYTMQLVTDQLSENGFMINEVIGYVYQPYCIGIFLRKIIDMPIMWRVYRLFMKNVAVDKAKILIGTAAKIPSGNMI